MVPVYDSDEEDTTYATPSAPKTKTSEKATSAKQPPKPAKFARPKDVIPKQKIDDLRVSTISGLPSNDKLGAPTDSPIDVLSTLNCEDDVNVKGCARPKCLEVREGPSILNGLTCVKDKLVLPDAPALITIDPTFVTPNGTTQFNTASEAADFLRNTRISGTVKVKFVDGVHDSIIIKDFARAVQARATTPVLAEELDTGVYWIGDERRIIGQTYIDSAINFADTAAPDITVSTNVLGVGPYVAVLASFGGFPSPAIVRPGVLSNSAGVPPVSEQADVPILNGAAIATNIGICRRGTIGFNAKAANLEGVGAVAMICINNTAGNDAIGMGGVGIPTTIPSVNIGLSDGNALLAAIIANPGMLITIASATPNRYSPALGTQGGNVDLSHPLGNLAKLDVTLTTAPTADPPRPLAAIAVENPNFADPNLGPVVAGDTVIVLLDSGVTAIRTIASLEESVPASGFFNRLVFTVPLPGTASGPDASVTFRSKVLCRSTDINRPALILTDSSVLLQGITVTGGGFVGTTGNQSYVRNTNFFPSNLTFEDPTTQYNTGILLLHSQVTTSSKERRANVPVSFTGHSTSINHVSSVLRTGSWTISDGRAVGTGLQVQGGATTAITSLRISTRTKTYGIQATGAARGMIGAGILHVSGALTGIGTVSLETGAGSNIDVTANTYLAIVRCGVGANLGRTDTLSTSSFEGWGAPTFSANTTRDLTLRDKARVVIAGPNVTFSGTQTYRVLDKAELVVDATTTFAPNGVKRYTAAGALDHALGEHLIAGAAAINLTIAPSAATRLWLGRKYTVRTETAFAHSITLTGGALFYGNGFAGTATATFTALKGNTITFTVKDATTVYVDTKYNAS